MNDSTFTGLITLPLLCIAALFAMMLYRDHTAQQAPQGTAAAQSVQEQFELTREVRALLEVHYDGEVDSQAIVNGGLQGMARAMDDRYTALLPPIEARYAGEETQGSYSGIGVTITRKASGDGTLIVRGVYPGGPADQGGIEMGDRITAVREVAGDGETVSLIGKDFDGARALIRGDADTQIELTILRSPDSDDAAEGEEQELKLMVTRGSLPILSVRGTRMLDGEGKIGYTRISDFHLNTPDQLLEAIEELKQQGAQALVLDLRENPGGVLGSAVRIADMFIAEEEKVIVSTKAKQEKLKRLKEYGIDPDTESAGYQWKTQDDVAEITLPTVVLMNQASASASEVLAGALQDYNLALIVGTRSYGKGLVQRPFPLKSDPRYTLKITIASYYTPLGNNLRRSRDDAPGGITPDLYFPLSSSQHNEMIARFNLQTYELPKPGRSFYEEEDRRAWEAADPQIVAAQKVLRGEPVNVPAYAGMDLPEDSEDSAKKDKGDDPDSDMPKDAPQDSSESEDHQSQPDQSDQDAQPSDPRE